MKIVMSVANRVAKRFLERVAAAKAVRIWVEQTGFDTKEVMAEFAGNPSADDFRSAWEAFQTQNPHAKATPHEAQKVDNTAYGENVWTIAWV